MSKKLISMVNKNFRLFARSRASSLVIFLGPLLIVLLVGVSFTNTQFLLNVGVYSEKYTNLTDSVVSKLSTSQFKIIKLNSENSCITSVRTGSTQICAIFPKDFEIKEGRTNQVTFYVDFSKITLVYMVLDVISGRVGERAKEISVYLTEDLLQRVGTTTKSLTEKKAVLGGVYSDVKQSAATLTKDEETLAALDLSVSIDSFKINEIEAKVSSAKNSLIDAISTIDDIKSKVEESNLTSEEKDNLKDDLDEAKTQLNSALTGVQGAGNGTSLLELVSGARTALTDIEKRLQTASAKRSDIARELASIRTTLNKNIDQLDSTLKTMEDIIKSLSSLQIANATQIVTPITTNIKPVTVEKTFFSLAFPTLLVLFIMVTGILLSSTMVIVEKKSVAFFRNAITPTTDLMFNLATYVTGLVTMFVQVLIFIIIASFLFTINILPSIHLILLILILVITFFVFIGMIIGFVFKSEETGTLAAITVSSILLFFSSVVLPIETLPPLVKSIADFNPFVISESMLKQAMLFQFGFRELGTQILIFLVYVLILFGILLGLQKLVKSHFLIHRHKSRELKK